MKQKHFTLIELLVVIGIIGILAAIVIPAVGKGTDRAQQATCISNLKQLGIGFSNYTADNNNILTPYKSGSTDWPDLIYEYVKEWEVYSCPAAGEYKSYTSSSESHELSYLINELVHRNGTSGSNKMLKLYQIDTPAKAITLAPNAEESDDMVLSYAPTNSGSSVTLAASKLDLKRHLKKEANFLYVDGHAASVPAERIKTGSSSSDMGKFWLPNP